MQKTGIWIWGIILFLFLAIAGMMSVCFFAGRIQVDKNNTINLPEWSTVSLSQWQILAQKKIFFAHMSVGNNILDGAKAVLAKHPEVSVTIEKTSNPEQMRLPGIYHESLGYNSQPSRKVESFRELLNKIQTAAPDIVLMKFCYVDITRDTDIHTLFETYHKAIDELRTHMSDTQFLHCTAPLTSPPKSLKRKCKESLKSIMGRSNYVDDNFRRFQFNEMIKKTWPAEQILDIAQIESITPEGYLHYKTKKGYEIPVLYGNYTDDGGHLNDPASRRVGEQLLIFLAKNVYPAEK